MRPDLYLRRPEITKSLSTAEKRVTRVTDTGSHTLSYVAATRVTPAETAGGDFCHTLPSVTEVVTRCVTASGDDPDDWFAHFEERAAIRASEGGFDRAEAERLALDETIAARARHSAIH